MALRVILLVGCAGSGKSTYARQQFPCAPIVSADHYFERMAVRCNQTYRQVFDVRGLRVAHAQCEEAFLSYLERDTPLVIVDNTNVRGVDQRRYAKRAKALGYETELHVFSPWVHERPSLTPEDIRRYVYLCHGRNIHGVPLDIVSKQFSQVDLPSGIYLAGKPPQFLRSMPTPSLSSMVETD